MIVRSDECVGRVPFADGTLPQQEKGQTETLPGLSRVKCIDIDPDATSAVEADYASDVYAALSGAYLRFRRTSNDKSATRRP